MNSMITSLNAMLAASRPNNHASVTISEATVSPSAENHNQSDDGRVSVMIEHNDDSNAFQATVAELNSQRHSGDVTTSTAAATTNNLGDSGPTDRQSCASAPSNMEDYFREFQTLTGRLGLEPMFGHLMTTIEDQIRPTLFTDTLPVINNLMSTVGQRNASETANNADATAQRQNSDNHDAEAKLKCLMKLETHENNGLKTSRPFTINDTLADLERECQHLNDLHGQKDNANRLQFLFISGIRIIEMMVGDSLLHGWADSVSDNMDQYAPLLERLCEKWRNLDTTIQMPPELQILVNLVGSGMAFYLTQQLMRRTHSNIRTDFLPTPLSSSLYSRPASPSAAPLVPLQVPPAPPAPPVIPTSHLTSTTRSTMPRRMVEKLPRSAPRPCHFPRENVSEYLDDESTIDDSESVLTRDVHPSQHRGHYFLVRRHAPRRPRCHCCGH